MSTHSDPSERHHTYGHNLLTDKEQEAFILSSSRMCPVDGCGEYMTQKENPIRSSDSWWFTCPNGHATWIGK